MKAILNFCGWTKKADIDRFAISVGYIRVAFHPPMEVLAHKMDVVCSDAVKTVDLLYTGKSKDALPIFKYEV